ncbi:MAG TPA: polymer-forming cytoskeletal protein [Candidatus Atribacteria bacterium]|nr:polymer-forming cytoskeletal protein [Candidatus Atribacteria bacterium]
MGKKNSKTQYDKVSTIIADDVVIKDGHLQAEKTIRIEGRLLGDINTRGSLVIGTSGHVEGDISCENILICGYIQGNIKACGQIHITETGVVNGDITCQNIVIDEGAIFTGKCTINKEPVKKGNGLFTPNNKVDTSGK